MLEFDWLCQHSGRRNENLAHLTRRIFHSLPPPPFPRACARGKIRMACETRYMDNSVFKCHYRILSGLLLGSLRVSNEATCIYKCGEACTFAVQCLHYLSLELRQGITITSVQSQTEAHQIPQKDSTSILPLKGLENMANTI